MKYIAVVGSRGYSDYDEFLNKISHYTKNIKEPITFVSGAASSGADNLIAKFCREHDIPIIEFKADWERYGKSAGMKRNIFIIEKADFVLAFWNGVSKGTLHSIGLAKKMKVPLRIVKV
jgi:hypothetical protein